MQIETIIQTKNNSQVKETWNKPEISLIDIKEQTLGHGGTHADGAHSVN